MKTVMNWSSVPEGILYEILLRLPVKSLCRFKCVSKSWFSIISDPKFTSDHFDRSLANPKVLLLSEITYKDDVSGERIYAVDYAEWVVRKRRNRPRYLIRSQSGSFPISQSVGGLSLVRCGNSLVIYNPSTRESIRFNPPPRPVWFDSIRDGLYICRNYLGFDPIEKKHKVLSTFTNLMRSKDEWSNYVITLGEEDDAWRSVECKYYPPFVYDSGSICIDGVIYYISRDRDASGSVGYVDVVGFDVRLETFKSIRVPDSFLCLPIFLMEYGGCVAVLYYRSCVDKSDGDEYRVIVVSVLTDFLNEQWRCEKYHVPYEYYLAGSSPKGELVFVSSNNPNLIKLYCYDTEAKRMKKINVRESKGRRERTQYDGTTVIRHAERLESLQGLSPTTYHYQRY